MRDGVTMREPMRVLHVFGRLDMGGAETMIMNIYRKIDREKIQFDFVKHTEEECAYDEEIQMLGGNIFCIPKYKGYNHFTYVKAWKSLLLSNSNYNIVHGHVRSTASIYLSIAKTLGKTTISHSHSISSGKGFSSIVKNILQYPIRYTADYFFACSYEAGKWLFGERTTKKDKFKIINNSIDAEKYAFSENVRQRIRKKYGLENKYVIGHVGRFEYPKNHSFLIKVFNQLNCFNNNTEIVLLMVGKGSLFENVKKEVERLKLYGKVKFLGEVSNVNEIYQAIDLFVFPSIYEGLGMSLIEAQAAGLKCIVSEKIPKEAIISDMVRVINLDKDINAWVECIQEEFKYYERKNNLELVRRSGFDINDNIIWLEKYYLSI